MKIKGLLFSGMIFLIAACGNQSNGDFTNITVMEVEQVASYTYLLVKAKGPEYWVAVPTMDASPGDKYYYQGGMLMEDFYSKDLDRTFEKVYFLETLFSEQPISGQAQASSPHTGSAMPHAENSTPGSQAIIEKANVSVEKIEGTVSIAELYADPKAYEGKRIQVGGEVVKFSPAIMDRNWLHIQDGTEFEGKFDLTITTDESFEVGSIVSVEGILAVNIDFGYGYNYEILVEKATALKEL